MHPSSYNEMRSNIDLYFKGIPPGSSIFDVGSLDVNGTYRDLVEPRFKYWGVDISAGPNVDIIMADEFTIPVSAGAAAGVISGQCLEHCRNPFKLVREIFRVGRPGAPVLLTAPWVFQIHRYPLDCWRILPDGMEILITEAGGKFIKSYVVERDCWGIGVVQ